MRSRGSVHRHGWGRAPGRVAAASRSTRPPEADERSRAPSRAVRREARRDSSEARHRRPRRRRHGARPWRGVAVAGRCAIRRRARRPRRRLRPTSEPAAADRGRRRRPRARHGAAAATVAGRRRRRRRPRRGRRRRARLLRSRPTRWRSATPAPTSRACSRRSSTPASSTATSTGQFDNATYEAVEQLQAERDLFVDGVVGRETGDLARRVARRGVVRRPHAAAARGRRGPVGLRAVVGRRRPATTRPRRCRPTPGTGRRVVYDRAGQRVWAVDEDDQVIRSWLVSGSKYEQRGARARTRSTAGPSSRRRGTARRSCR